MNNTIRNDVRKFLVKKLMLFENLQLADKIYFNTGKLSQDDKNLILQITNGDNYTKLISDMYFTLKNDGGYNIVETLTKIYDDVLNYNKNVFPIEGFSLNNADNVYTLIKCFELRRKIIELIRTLPSFAIRNMKNEIRTQRGVIGFDNYLDTLQYVMSYVSYLSNRSEDIRNKILKKIFKSNITLSDVSNFIDDKTNLIGGVNFDRKKITELSKTEDLEIIYDEKNVMIVKVYSASAIKAIGCNSLWCFTYGSGFSMANKDWYRFSYNDMVYVLIDFNESSDSETFMYVVINPLLDEYGELMEFNEENEHPIYNMSNENYSDPYSILMDLFGNDYETIIHKYLNFDE